ncbi:MAG: AlpA family phage regulatory protein [Azonexus sp.]|jgi:predicted DNA-binding transcriptional regulator AlpA|nr:AlpA family phage regulatory protein [Azonexus sp.]
MAATVQKPQLPAEGYVRLPGVLSVVPVSRSTWFSWVKSGKAPKPVKLSERTTAWRVADIRAFIDAQAA